MDFESADTVEGTISISGNTTSYNAFMGSHWTQLKDSQKELPVGTIVVSTGKIIPSRNDENEDKFPFIEKSSKRAQKGVYGVWHAKMSNTAEDHSFGDPDKPIYQIASLGLYYVRVTDTNGDIRNGDYMDVKYMEDDEMKLSKTGEITQQYWIEIPACTEPDNKRINIG